MHLTAPCSGGVVVAVSGGADSTALAVLLADAKVGPLHLAHVVHGYRPEQAAQEHAALQNLSRQIAAPLSLLHLKVPPNWRPGDKIPEAAARTARYAALFQLARELRFPQIALAHQAQDHEETALLMLLRGGGLAALRGMTEVTRREGLILWRPLLGHRREWLCAELEQRGMVWCEDSSNRDLRLRRNAVRHRLLPELRAAEDPLVARLGKLRELAARALAHVDRQVERQLTRARPAARDGTVVLDPTWFAAMSPALQFECVRALARRLLPDGLWPVRGGEILELARFIVRDDAHGGARGGRRVGALEVERARESVSFMDARVAPPPAGAVLELTATPASLPGCAWEAWLEAGPHAVASAHVRTRRLGERITLPDGTLRSLKHLFQQRAVPPSERPFWPILDLGDGHQLVAPSPSAPALLLRTGLGLQLGLAGGATLCLRWRMHSAAADHSSAKRLPEASPQISTPPP